VKNWCQAFAFSQIQLVPLQLGGGGLGTRLANGVGIGGGLGGGLGGDPFANWLASQPGGSGGAQQPQQQQQQQQQLAVAPAVAGAAGAGGPVISEDTLAKAAMQSTGAREKGGALGGWLM
jgi:hypothetical protein